jgi:hypothetical protein
MALSISDIDEALMYAQKSIVMHRSEKEILSITKYIDDLLDKRLEVGSNDHNCCNPISEQSCDGCRLANNR